MVFTWLLEEKICTSKGHIHQAQGQLSVAVASSTLPGYSTRRCGVCGRQGNASSGGTHQLPFERGGGSFDARRGDVYHWEGAIWVTRDFVRHFFLGTVNRSPRICKIRRAEIVFSWAKVVFVALKFEVVSFNTWIHVFNDLGSRWNTDVVVSLVSIWGCKKCIFQISHACFGKKPYFA